MSMNSSLNNGAAAAPPARQQPPPTTGTSRYENQKRRDWNTFGQYLRGQHKPGPIPGPVPLSQCSGAHVLDFLRYLDQFGKTKVHCPGCPFYGLPSPPAPCPCPLRQAWGSLDSLVGRLRAAFEENGGSPASNPFAARSVRLFLREVRDAQSKARGVSYDKKKKRKQRPKQLTPPTVDSTASNASSSDHLPPLPSPSCWSTSGGGHYW